ncbi:MAG: trypsin-like peptidase domain-containing protein [Candidatus Melainabacteria bacterium]|nr:trypsin-like peptidase domain-containing protein [Candidatus Melainabacteria bacterium]
MKVPQVIKAAVLGLIGTGVAGNGYLTYQNQLEHTQTVEQLKQELNQSNGTVQNLRNTLQKDQTSMQSLSTQISALNRELGTRITLDQIISAVSQVTPSTVRVEGQVERLNPFTGEIQRGTVIGSGVIIIGNHGERYILTNGHVTEGSEIRRNGTKDSVYHIKVYNGSDYRSPVEFDAAPVILSNGERAYSSPDKNDLALLLIPPNVELPRNVVCVRMRDITQHPLQLGEPVFAIGNPFGERDSVSFGHISHTDRRAEGLNINHHIQTDAPINPGNSGGGLFSVRIIDGRPVVELVGINTWGYRGSDGVGGSIRVDYIQQVLRGWGVRLSQ